MFRATGILVLSLCFGPAALSQSVPKDLLSLPVSLGLDKPTTEVKAGSTVTYTVTLRNTRDQAVAASSDLPLAIETPSGMQEATLQKGQSSASFSWQAVKSGVVHMTVRSGKLHPATGLVLVAPGPTSQLLSLPFKEHPIAETLHSVPKAGHNFAIGSLAGSSVRNSLEAEHRIPTGTMASKPTAEAAPQAVQSFTAALAPPPVAPVTAAFPPGQAKKIQIYIQPLPVYGDAVDRIWKANVSVAAEGQNDELMAVSQDVPVHFIASFGQLSASDITLSPGQFSNFEKPIVLTANRSGQGIVNAISSLGSTGPVSVDYLQPPPTQLRLSLGTPQLSGGGASSATVQVCLLDEAGGLTASTQSVDVTLAGPGQLSKSVFTILRESPCSEQITWTSDGAGPSTIRAESSGINTAEATLVFPAFPWYFVWFAAGGGLLGALVVSPGGLFSASWWSYTWRGLVVGAILGAIFYLFARFGAIALPKDSPVNLQNIPVVSDAGSFLLGFLGGVYGRKLWKIDDKP